jgi:hypothetical protein
MHLNTQIIMVPLRACLLCLGLIYASGCDFLLGEDERPTFDRQLGVIEFHSDPVSIYLPQVVSRAQPFEVSVRTYGGGCVKQGDTEFQVTDMSVTIQPFDSFVVSMPSNYACVDIIRLFSHKVLLTFEDTGVARISVRGRKEPGGDVITVTRSINVE